MEKSDQHRISDLPKPRRAQVDKHVKGEQLDIIPNQEVTTHFRIYDKRGMDSVVQASENGGVGSVRGVASCFRSGLAAPCPRELALSAVREVYFPSLLAS